MPVTNKKARLKNNSLRFFMNIPDKPHIGKLVREQLRKNGHSTVWLAKQLGCDRSKLYRIFANPDIYCSDLWKIAVILKHDFFCDLSEYFSECSNF